MKKLLALLLIVLFLSSNLVYPQQAEAKVGREKFMGGQILVKFRANASEWDINQEIKKHSGRIDRKLNKINTIVLQVPQSQEDQTMAALVLNPKVEYSELDYIAQALDFPSDSAPSDPSFATNQWGLENTGQTIQGHLGKVNADINAQGAWQTTLGAGIKVAVLDSGIDASHPDLSGKIDLSQDFTGSGTTDDMYGHGTHVSGIVAANTNNAMGISGTCPSCHLLNGKVLDNNGSGAYSWIANGIVWATDNGAKVINLSLGGSAGSLTLQNAINYALSHNVVVVAAAGNSGTGAPLYPAAYANVVSVAATNNVDQKASFSNYGANVSVAAPGESIYSTFPTHTFALKTQYGMSNNYDFGSGTSMATPMASGVAGLIWSTSYGTNSDAVRNRLFSTADQIAGTGTYWHYGRINAAKAVAAGTPVASASPSATPIASASATPVASASAVPTSTPIPTPSPSPTSQPTVLPTASPKPSASPINGIATSTKVTSITYQPYGGLGNNQYLRVSVTVNNNLNKVVPNATVMMTLKNSTTGQTWSAGGATNTFGTAIFTLYFVPAGTYSTTVTNVAAGGLSWDGVTPANSYAKK